MGSQICQIPNNPSKVCPRLLRLCQTVEITPNLVTLLPTCLNRARGTIYYFERIIETVGCRLCHKCLFQNSNNQHRRCNEKRSCVQLKTCNTVVVSLGSTKKVANAIFIDAYEATDQDLLV